MNRIDYDDGTSACTGLETSQVVAALEEYHESLTRRSSHRP